MKNHPILESLWKKQFNSWEFIPQKKLMRLSYIHLTVNKNYSLTNTWRKKFKINTSTFCHKELFGFYKIMEKILPLKQFMITGKDKKRKRSSLRDKSYTWKRDKLWSVRTLLMLYTNSWIFTRGHLPNSYTFKT